MGTTPAVKRLARDLGVDLSGVVGTGENGKITEDDVKKASTVKDDDGYIERVPLRGVRKATTVQMSEAVKHQALVATMDEVDVTELVEILGKNTDVSYLPFVVKAVVAALKEHPYLNSELNEENQEIVIKKYYNIGVAVDTPDGLVVPIVKNADRKNMFSIRKEIEKFTDKAVRRELEFKELKGGTFTITNIGALGGTHFTPIPNYPESAILNIGMIHDKAVVVGGEVVVRKVLPLSLTFDHRVLDGAMAQRFLNVVMQHLNDPNLIFG